MFHGAQQAFGALQNHMGVSAHILTQLVEGVIMVERGAAPGCVSGLVDLVHSASANLAAKMGTAAEVRQAA